MSKPIDMTGQRFGLLTVLYRADPPSNKHRQPVWHCRCDCGSEIDVAGLHLRSGHTQSCGCYKRKRSSETHSTHHMTNTKLYYVWSGMIRRCTSPSSKSYQYYGARGISVCEEWLDPCKFLEWAVVGYKDGLTLDRIDVNGNYEPSNCRWVDVKEQNRNRRSNIIIEYDGQTMCLFDWAATVGIPPKTLWCRIKELGWSFERAITTPVRKYRKENNNASPN